MYKKYKQRLNNAFGDIYGNPLIGLYPLRFLQINLGDLIFYCNKLMKALQKLDKNRDLIQPLSHNKEVGFEHLGIGDEIRRNLENALEKLYYSYEKIWTLIVSLPFNPVVKKKNMNKFKDPCFKEIYKKLNDKSSTIQKMIKIRNKFKATETPFVFYKKERAIYVEKIYKGFPYHQKENLPVSVLAKEIEKSIISFIKVLEILSRHIRDSEHFPKLVAGNKH